MRRLLVMLLLLYPLSAVAQTYEWTDAQGTVHFTEDLGKVPKKYRKKAKVIGGDESGVPQISVTTEPEKGKPKLDEADKGKKLYGGKDENAWRNEFLAAKKAVKNTETELSELQGRMTDTSKMSRSEYLAIQNTIHHTEVRLQGVQKKLDQLTESANRAGVPMDARQ